jgi:6-phosphofructokinase 2
MRPVLTVTLNPALDVTTTTDRLVPQQKLRCSAPRQDPGGGGVNVSRAIKELGGDSRAFIAAGGSTGAELEALLATTGIPCEFWPLAEATRFSLTVMEELTGLHYRFVLPGPTFAEGEADRLLQRLEEIIAADPGFVVGSGSLPPGVPVDFYGTLARRCRELGAKFIIDTHGPALRAAAAERPYLIRLNHLEAQELLGGEAEVAAHRLARQLIERGLAEAAIVTIGARGAFVADHAHEIEIPPPIVKVRSSVGAGDSFVAALTFGLANEWPLNEAARYGVAAAAAAVTAEGTGLCKRADVNRFFAEIGGDLPHTG